MTSPLPRSRVAAVQAAPVFLDTPATVDKACALIAEATGNGASLVAFPEVFISAYPYWNWLLNPVDGSRWFRRLWASAITVPGPEVEQLCKAARTHGCTVVIGCNERPARGAGTIYNSNLIIGPDGTLLGTVRLPETCANVEFGGADRSTLFMTATTSLYALDVAVQGVAR